MRPVQVSAVPGRVEVDPLLAEFDPGAGRAPSGTGAGRNRVLVRGTDAALAAVVLRVLRKQRLADLELAYVPVEAGSAVAHLWGVPGPRAGAEAVRLALEGAARPAPLVRDDVGGVVLGSSVIAPVEGRVYCEDERVLEGAALRLEISPDPDAQPLPRPAADPLSVDLQPAEDGVRVGVTRRWMLRKRREFTRGRAVQAAFAPAVVVSDGVEHPRRAEKWGWYRHTEDLLLVR